MLGQSKSYTILYYFSYNTGSEASGWEELKARLHDVEARRSQPQ